MHMISNFLTFNKNTPRGGTYYVNYYNLRLWLEDWFPGYSFTLNTDITDNTIAVNISKVLPDDIGDREVYIACAKIPIAFIIHSETYRIRQVVQNAIL